MPRRAGLNHIAIAWPDRESWLKQIAFLQSKGVPFHRRINHGMTHSVYISDPDGHGIEVLSELPREVWEHDIDGAQNYSEAPVAVAHRGAWGVPCPSVACYVKLTGTPDRGRPPAPAVHVAYPGLGICAVVAVTEIVTHTARRPTIGRNKSRRQLRVIARGSH